MAPKRPARSGGGGGTAAAGTPVFPPGRPMPDGEAAARAAAARADARDAAAVAEALGDDDGNNDNSNNRTKRGRRGTAILAGAIAAGASRSAVRALAAELANDEREVEAVAASTDAEATFEALHALRREPVTWDAEANAAADSAGEGGGGGEGEGEGFTGAACPRCGHRGADFVLQQTRRADEARTAQLRCRRCAHAWKSQ